MLAKILPLALALTGIGAGVGAGIALRPAPETHEEALSPCGDVDAGDHDAASANHAGGDADTAGHGDAPAPADDGHGGGHAAADDGHGGSGTDFVKMSNQFVVPVLHDGAVTSMVVLSLTLEVASGQSEAVVQREPKLRDAFLSELLAHANRGGFDGPFTSNGAMERLRLALAETGSAELGGVLEDVLILDLNRKDF